MRSKNSGVPLMPAGVEVQVEDAEAAGGLRELEKVGAVTRMRAQASRYSACNIQGAGYRPSRHPLEL